MAVVPGMPTVPFAALGLGFVFLGRAAKKKLANRVQEEIQKEEDEKVAEQSDDSIESLMKVDSLSLVVGVGLIPLVDVSQDGEVLERIVSARKQFATDLGVVIPQVMVKDSIHLKPDQYEIRLKGHSIGSGELMIDRLLAMDPGDIPDPIDGIRTKEPAYNLDAVWVKKTQKDEATFRGYTVVNSSTVIVTHLTKLIEDHTHELLTRQEVQHLIDSLKEDHPKVVEEVIGADRLELGDIVKILQNLLREKVSIRDLLTIFETLADHAKKISNPDALTRYVRKSLGRGIVKKYADENDKLNIITLDRSVEDVLVSHLQHREDGGSSLNIEPQMAKQLLGQYCELP